uniref:Uncharacterized protein n=1 Tax=Ditylenchus dipsaci TaxID=166011 RepID=A0A915DL44_9BILA
MSKQQQQQPAKHPFLTIRTRLMTQRGRKEGMTNPLTTTAPPSLLVAHTTHGSAPTTTTGLPGKGKRKAAANG